MAWLFRQIIKSIRERHRGFAQPGHPRQIHAFDVTDTNTLQAIGCSAIWATRYPMVSELTKTATSGAVLAGLVPRRRSAGVCPNGDKIGAIHTPEGISNVCFGGANRNRLFMTGLSRFTACTPKLRAWRTPESFVQIVLQTSKALLVRL